MTEHDHVVFVIEMTTSSTTLITMLSRYLSETEQHSAFTTSACSYHYQLRTIKSDLNFSVTDSFT